MSRHRNGHRLRRLKHRRNAQQLAARRQRMEKGGTWRQEMVNSLNETFLRVAKVVNKNQDINDTRNKRAIGVHVLLGVGQLLVIGRVLGWW